jgi:hypothetical protein
MTRRFDIPGQLDLAMHEADPTPEVDSEDVRVLVEGLRSCPANPTRRGWKTAEELATFLKHSRQEPGWTDRKVRATARAAAPAIVSYPGSPGYKLWADCTVEEIDHAINAFDSQAKDMTARAMLYRNAYHRRYRG